MKSRPSWPPCAPPPKPSAPSRPTSPPSEPAGQPRARRRRASKVGHYLCFHRACDGCIDWLLSSKGNANQKRLAHLSEYV
jgi:hypothetical protein